VIERLGMRIVAVGTVALGVVILAYLTSWLFVWLLGYVAAVAYLRDGRRVTVARLRMQVYLEPRDVWVGACVAPQAVFVCPAPCVVFRFARRSL
jgi:hypothetical protein